MSRSLILFSAFFSINMQEDYNAEKHTVFD